MTDRRAAIRESPSQTAGPYVHIGCTPNFGGMRMYGGVDLGAEMISGPPSSDEIVVEGSIHDGQGAPLVDALVEFWQADREGQFVSADKSVGGQQAGFSGWARIPTDMETGLFRLRTVKPGCVPLSSGEPQAPHISVWIVARGINVGLQTRVYFEDESKANAADPLLREISDKTRRNSLIATRTAANVYRFDIHLQGRDETVFLDI